MKPYKEILFDSLGKGVERKEEYAGNKFVYVGVSSRAGTRRRRSGNGWKLTQIYSNSGDDGKEDPPVPIPNTEVKLFYAESTYG